MSGPGAVPSASAAPGPASPVKSSWGLGLRIASGVLFVPLLIVLARVGGRAFLALVALEVVLGLIEFYRMAAAKGLRPVPAVGFPAALALLWFAFRPETPHADLLVAAALLLLLLLALRHPEAPRSLEGLAVTVLGVLYVGWLSAYQVLLRELPWRAGTDYAAGGAFVLLAFFVTWSCDTAAFVFGRAFGRTRPWTLISPRKSVEGSVGGLLAAVAAAFVARAWFAPFLRPWDAAAIGVLVGVFGQVGDLVESLLKRDAEHGDSSDIIPGHGGVLDRFDSLYFGAPIVFYYLKLVVFQAP